MKRKVRLLYETLMFTLIDRLSRKGSPDEKAILFVSDIRGEMGGNFKYIKDYMADKGYSFKYDFRPGKNNVRSFGELRELVRKMSSCRYIVLEDYFHFSAYKKYSPKQKICQVWHGAGAFKKFAHSRATSGDNIKIHKGYRMYSKAITSSPEINWCYAEAFNIDESKVKATGIPGTDLYFHKEEMAKRRDELLRDYPVLKDKKLILFAPTYRAGSQRDASYDLNMLDLEGLYRELKDDYVFAFKWHPAMYENVKGDAGFNSEISRHPDFFLDLSAHRDISEILPSVRVLITDYSSVIFDYYLLDRPIVFFPYDMEEYEGARGLYYNYDKYTYGRVVTSQDELIQAARAEDMCPDKREEFGKTFMSACDGHSTEKTCRWFFQDENV